MGVAGQLPAELGGALLVAAREAFTQGMQLTAALSAAVAVGVAILATVLLRAVPAPAQAEAAERLATPPEPEPQPEPAIQVIRPGSGCLACPGERSFSQADGAP